MAGDIRLLDCSALMTLDVDGPEPGVEHPAIAKEPDSSSIATMELLDFGERWAAIFILIAFTQ